MWKESEEKEKKQPEKKESKAQEKKHYLAGKMKEKWHKKGKAGGMSYLGK